MNQIPSISSSSSRYHDETGMEEVQTDMMALKRLYALLHKGSADENLDEKSRAYLMRILDDATRKALLRQGEMISGSPMSAALERNLSIRSDRRSRAVEARRSLNPPASPSLSLHQVSERLHRLNLHHSPSSSRGGHRHAAQEPVFSRIPSNRSARTAMLPQLYPSREQPNLAASRPLLSGHNSISSSRGGRHAHSHRHAAEESHLSRLASNCSSRTAAPPPHHPSWGQPSPGLSLYRLSVAATSQHGTMTGRSPRTDVRDRTRPSFGLGDHPSMERRSMRPSVSQELSRGRERQQDHAVARGMGAEGSSSTRHFGRLGSGLSLGMTSRRGSERGGRGGAFPGYSSSASSNEVATIHSRIRPHRELKERFLRRAEEEESTSRGRREDDAFSSVGWSSSRPRRTLKRVDSGSTYISSSLGAASSFTYTSHTVSPASSASASSYSSPVSRWGSARPAYASEASELSRSPRRRRERKERREGRLRRLTKKIAMVFHHRHDHHHHHHYPRGKEVPPRSDRCTLKRKSAWKHLGGMFQRTKGQDKKTATQTTVSVPAKKRGGGGHTNVLFGAMRHLRGKRKTPASVKMKKMASRVQVKKMNWWQQLRKRRGKPRRRLGHGKAV